MTRGAKGTYQCKRCGDPFTARVADRNRGWARFCSKSCKAAEQERRTGQNARYHARQAERDHDEILFLATGPADEWR